MADFVFTDPGGTAVTARMRESTTVGGTKTLVTGTDVAISGLTLVDGKRRWSLAAADGTKYYWLSFLDSAGEEGPDIILAPQADAGTFVLQVNSRDIVGEVVEGLELIVESSTGVAVSGNNTLVEGVTATTDASGFAEIRPYAGPTYRVIFAGEIKTIDASGLDGQTVNLKDYV